MVDSFGRRITYLRVSVTDRCNLRCCYCAPGRPACRPAPAYPIRQSDLLSFTEICDVVRAAAELGINKVRITGGEPLVRDGVERLVEMIAAIEGIEDLSMTTNGTLLAGRARALASAGLQRVNVSLDAIDPALYRRITGGGDVSRVLAGIDSAKEAGLQPIKLNCVVRQSSREAGARQVAQFARSCGLQVRFIKQMDLAAGTFAKVENGTGGDCSNCNRLRLSSDGLVRPCLFSDIAFDVGRLGVRSALEQAIAAKPEAGTFCSHGWIGAIGG